MYVFEHMNAKGTVVNATGLILCKEENILLRPRQRYYYKSVRVTFDTMVIIGNNHDDHCAESYSYVFIIRYNLRCGRSKIFSSSHSNTNFRVFANCANTSLDINRNFRRLVISTRTLNVEFTDSACWSDLTVYTIVLSSFLAHKM